MKRFLISLIRFYQILISPLFGSACRFYPSCSNYAAQAINEEGALRGLWLALKRLLRCHPFTPGGYEPISKRSFGKVS
ncbi:MAG: membrane protein insertion efficiency factor YidD [Candidatus Omnitrophica bacterium]|nr:membrane protein insertion efficiency factor YidD [Candidatus Omnitrophota bacterium]